MNILNSAMGAGILLFPSQFADLGIILGPASLVLVAGVMVYTLRIIGRAGYQSNSRNYQEAVKTVLGPTAGKLMCVTMSAYILGTCVSYLILIADQVTAVFSYDWVSRTAVTIGAGLLALPMMMMPDITLLAYTSTFGVLAQFYIIICIFYHCIHGIVETGVEPSPFVEANWGPSLGSAVALYTFSLQCHMVFIPAVSKLRYKTQARVDGAAFIGIFTSVMFYLAMGILGYLNYGASVKPDIVAYNLPDTVDVQIARLALAVKSLMAYPLLHFIARMSIADLIGYDLTTLSWNDPDYPREVYRCLTLAFQVISVITAIFISQIDILIDLIGAIFGVFQVYFWPALLYYNLLKSEKRTLRRVRRTFVSLILIVMCFSVTAFQLYNTFKPNLKGN
jgi:amino acid permease